MFATAAIAEEAEVAAPERNVWLSGAVEEAELLARGRSLGREFTFVSSTVGADVVNGRFLYGGSLSARRTTGTIGAGLTATEVRASGVGGALYGAFSPHPPFHVGLSLAAQYDEGVFDTPFGDLDSSLEAVDLRPFLLVAAPFADGLLKASAAFSVTHGTLKVETAPDATFTDLSGLAAIAFEQPLADRAVAEVSAEIRRIFREDVLLGGAERDRWSANFTGRLSLPLTDRAALTVFGAYRAFDALSREATGGLRIEMTF